MSPPHGTSAQVVIPAQRESSVFPNDTGFPLRGNDEARAIFVSAMIEIVVDGKTISVDSEMSLAAAMLQAGVTRFRTSVDGEPRAPLCGMGICFDCRVTIGEVRHIRACLARVEKGMEVRTDL